MANKDWKEFPKEQPKQNEIVEAVHRAEKYSPTPNIVKVKYSKGEFRNILNGQLFNACKWRNL